MAVVPPLSYDEVNVRSLPVVIGVDVGTSSIKAACYDDAEGVRGVGRVPTPWGEGVDGPHRLDPLRTRAAVMDAIAASLGRVDGAQVVAVGLGGMAETGLVCDADGSPAGPVIGWAEQRGTVEARDIGERLGVDEMAAWSGRRPSPLLPAATLWWLGRQDRSPRAGQQWFSALEWLAGSFGGVFAAEPSLASRTGLLDIVTGTWRADAAELVGVGHALPQILPAVRSRGVAGAEHGPLAGARIAVAGHDHLVAAVGADAGDDGDIFDSCGTNEAIVGVTGTPTPAAAAALAAMGGTMSRHVLPGAGAAFGPQYRSGEVLARVLTALGVDPGDAAATQAIAAAAARVEPIDAEVVTATDDALGALIAAEPPAALWRRAVDEVVATGTRRIVALEAVIGSARRIVGAGGWLDDLAIAAKRREMGDRFAAVAGDLAGTAGAARIARMSA